MQKAEPIRQEAPAVVYRHSSHSKHYKKQGLHNVRVMVCIHASSEHEGASWRPRWQAEVSELFVAGQVTDRAAQVQQTWRGGGRSTRPGPGHTVCGSARIFLRVMSTDV